MPHRTTLLLIRHAATDAVGGRLVSRMPGIRLTAEGIAQVELLRSRMMQLALDAVYSSPLERAVDTARPLADAHGLEVRICDQLTEVDFGDWTGLAFSELAAISSGRSSIARAAQPAFPATSRASTFNAVSCGRSTTFVDAISVARSPRSAMRM